VLVCDEVDWIHLTAVELRLQLFWTRLFNHTRTLTISQLTYSFQPRYGTGIDSALREMSNRNHSGCNGWPARKADNLTAICELIL
jgi:hypothetical protein